MDYNVDINDCIELSSLNDQLKERVCELTNSIEQFKDVKKALIRQFAINSDRIDIKMSWENKLIALQSIYNDDEKILELCNKYFDVDAHVKCYRLEKEQKEEEIKSQKKLIDIKPK